MPKIIAFDGTETAQGRALSLISALYWCADALRDVEVRFIDVQSPDVELALHVLYFETGIRAYTQPHGDNFRTFSLYAGIAFQSAAHMRLDEAKQHGTPLFVAIQFPEPEWMNATTLSTSKAAFDPQCFGGHVERIIRGWP